MPIYTLVADSGATKTEWRLLGTSRKKSLTTKGISPYYFSSQQITELVASEVAPWLASTMPQALHFYGTGCAVPANVKLVALGLQKALPLVTQVHVSSDLVAAARALCGTQKGVACILGTGSNSGVFNGKKITRNNPAPGFILGDEGSGAFLGKKVLQHFIYGTFDDELMHKFNLMYATDYRTILNHVYKQPWPNRYLASFAPFLSDNRGHYMIENILEDGLGEFFYNHLYKYPETWRYPINFVGSVAWNFKDVLADLCNSFQLQLGKVLQAPMDGLAAFHAPKQ
ncbi:MAG: N-acetylglucosamine kinase [Bacteroidetes bacterium]|nr:MAG: N-acetylglucosamine kinase [Bacteroidota bacterium]